MKESRRQLIARYLEGDPVETELLRACQEDPDTLEALSDQVVLDRFLTLMGVDSRAGEDAFAEKVIAGLPGAFPEEPFVGSAVGRIRRQRTWRRWRAAGLSIAAAAALFFGASQFYPGNPDTPFVEYATVIAVEASERLSPSVRVGNRPVLLDRGFAQLRFDHGTVLLVEGPARFEIVSDKRVKLDFGKAVATVPVAGHGFTIESPQAEIVDLGTQFGVEVSPEGDTEIHVIRGAVKARGIGEADFVTLADNQALRLSGPGRESERMASQAERFLLELPQPDAGRPAKYLHWAFDEGGGDATQPTGMGIDPRSGRGALSGAPGAAKPEWIPGVFGKALQFNGSGASIKTEFSGISGSAARTVSFWVKAPPGEPPGYAAMGWGAREEGGVWQISLNPAPEDGVVGGLRLGIQHGSVVGDADLRDNRWHHAAIVMYSGGEDIPANLRTHVLLYVDGELASASRRSLQRIHTLTETSAANPLVIGRSATPSRVFPDSFRGALDELFVVDKALSQAEIQRLMSENAVR